MADVVDECLYANSSSMSTFSEDTWMLKMIVIMMHGNDGNGINDGNDGTEQCFTTSSLKSPLAKSTMKSGHGISPKPSGSYWSKRVRHLKMLVKNKNWSKIDTDKVYQ